ncbi:alpha-tocopherol transfer protein-like [Clavelina lepadiformis]|uniref:CRAL-TRIO domain-containing protein n=1 Tax=Clavelina lepadiformis TaxID=159417 RepID=A0ABP0GFM7_CLALP
MSARYQFSLSKELLAKAVEELNEPDDDAERLKAIDLLKENYIATNPGLPLLRSDDKFLLKFLRARKFDQDRALKMLTNYHQQRNKWPEVFDKIKNPILLKNFLDAGVIVPLSGKAKNGCKVLVVRPGLVPGLITDTIALVMASLEKLSDEEETQIHGLIFIEDLAYISIDLVQQMSPAIAKRAVGIIQDAMPLRLKQINITNEPKIFDVISVIFQPFLKDKLKKRVRLHGTDFDALYQVVDRSVLPIMFAGSGPELDTEGWKNTILEEGTAL